VPRRARRDERLDGRAALEPDLARADAPDDVDALERLERPVAAHRVDAVAQGQEPVEDVERRQLDAREQVDARLAKSVPHQHRRVDAPKVQVCQ
jgi:hypothetical protein